MLTKITVTDSNSDAQLRIAIDKISVYGQFPSFEGTPQTLIWTAGRGQPFAIKETPERIDALIADTQDQWERVTIGIDGVTQTFERLKKSDHGVQEFGAYANSSVDPKEKLDI